MICDDDGDSDIYSNDCDGDCRRRGGSNSNSKRNIVPCLASQ